LRVNPIPTVRKRKSGKGRDPIKLYRQKLIETGNAHAEILDCIEAEVEQELDAAVEFARNSQVPAVETAFEDIYA